MLSVIKGDLCMHLFSKKCTGKKYRCRMLRRARSGLLAVEGSFLDENRLSLCSTKGGQRQSTRCILRGDRRAFFSEFGSKENGPQNEGWAGEVSEGCRIEENDNAQNTNNEIFCEEGGTVFEKDDCEDELILGDFVKNVYLGKPMGIAWDAAIEDLINKLMYRAKERSVSSLENLLDSYLGEIPDLETKKILRGRLVWKLLRCRGLIRQPAEDVLWVTTHMLIYMHRRYDSPGYCWGIYIEALNKCKLFIKAESVYQIAKSFSLEDPRFSSDMAFIQSARLSGIIQAFMYHAVPSAMEEMKSVCGTDLTGWAFNRILNCSSLLHLRQIHYLPHWIGSEDKEYTLPIKLRHYVVLMANIGQISNARSLWVSEYSKRVNDMSLGASHVEIQYLTLGIQVLGRAPQLYPPYDQILRILIDRIKWLLSQNSQDSVHVHGLVNHLCRARMSDYIEELAQCLLNYSESKKFLSPLCHYYALVGNEEKYLYWLSMRGDSSSLRYDAIDLYNSVLLDSHCKSCAELLKKIDHHRLLFPMQYTFNINTILAKRVNAKKDGLTIQEYKKIMYKLSRPECIRLSDIYHQQKYMLDLVIPGLYAEAEEFVFSPFRERAKKRDVLFGFLSYFYAVNGMHRHLINFLKRAFKVFSVRNVFCIIGNEKSVLIFEALKHDPDMILTIWPLFTCKSACRTELFSLLLDVAIAKNLPYMVENLWYTAELPGRCDNVAKMIDDLGRAIKILKRYSRFAHLAERIEHIRRLMQEERRKSINTPVQ
ncbi:uncharacterized protein LOC126315425 [Schistocerca gregaria]|uniref:uncharacterized protein LOC126315425 n=1 Tax=Schistocerca gregaria TaxID=7010 RepID=UPI00211E96B7|nr:uncharacterized protein LOC126315425 [Schistocerca gregaria]